MTTNTGEQQYLDLLKNVLENGYEKKDRTGTGTLSITGAMMKFCLKNDAFPLITTKKVNIRAIVEELLFFIRGQTDNKILTDKNVNIWKANSTKEFFAKYNIDREEGDLGPIYGFQWRHFGAEYTTSHEDYTNKGIDQLKNVIDAIKTDPNSRRLIVSSWNPLAIPQMALPPCHVLFQFIVRDNFLDCLLYQRSGDLGLGIPFNIASYALLTKMVAHVCGLEAGDFVHFIGDAHIYNNHIQQLKVQLTREPKKEPKLFFKRKVTNIEDFEFEDIEIVGYEPHEVIKMDMAV